jgi:hypothetical protein
MFPLVGSLGRITTLADSALATLLGTPAEVGRSSRYAVSIGEEPCQFDLDNRSATRGRFSYRHAEG